MTSPLDDDRVAIARRSACLAYLGLVADGTGTDAAIAIVADLIHTDPDTIRRACERLAGAA